jgi:hypothetical protein
VAVAAVAGVAVAEDPAAEDPAAEVGAATVDVVVETWVVSPPVGGGVPELEPQAASTMAAPAAGSRRNPIDGRISALPGTHGTLRVAV